MLLYVNLRRQGAKTLGDGSLNSSCTSKKRNIKPLSYAAAGLICLVRLRYSSKLQQMKRVVTALPRIAYVHFYARYCR